MLLGAIVASPFALAQQEATTEQKDFHLDGEFGLVLTTGNTENSSLRTRLSATHDMQNWHNEYLLEGLYTQNEKENAEGQEITETVDQRFLMSAQGNYKLDNPENRLFAFASYEDDRFSGFRYQGTIAGGWSSVWFDSPKHTFKYSFGPGYAFMERENREDVSSVVMRGSMDYKWNISDNANFKQLFSTEFGSENTKSRSESAISANIAEGLSMKFSVVLNHNSSVEAGFKRLDTETAATVVYTFF